MRKFLASFMVFALLASTIICGCGHEAQADSGAKASHSHEHDEADQDHKGSTLDEDCQKTDMQLPAYVSFDKPDLKTSFYLDFALVDQKVLWQNDANPHHDIRGPPPDWPELSQNQPSILLTTQRLRI